MLQKSLTISYIHAPRTGGCCGRTEADGRFGDSEEGAGKGEG